MTTPYTMRSHPCLQGTTPFNSVNLGITTHCTMRCPNCSVDVPGFKARGEARHCTIAELTRDSVHMKGLKRVHLTGGEPTLHPEFEKVMFVVDGYWRPEYLTIETNGAGYLKYRDLFPRFDLVFMTHYEKDAIYPGSPDNTAVLEQAQQDLGERLVREPPVRHDRRHEPELLASPLTVLQRIPKEEWEEVPCSKFYSPGLPSGWYGGLLFKCCVTVGIDRSLGIPVTANWREELARQPMGCAACLYRGT